MGNEAVRVMMREHEMDALSHYCIRCGQGADRIVQDSLRGCPSSENVVAISHRVRGRVLADLVSALPSKGE